MKFAYHGGTEKPTNHTIEKFLLFFIVGGKEVPAYSLMRSGLMRLSGRVYTRPGDIRLTALHYTTSFDIAKIFISQSGFGIPKQFYSLYIKLSSSAPYIITVNSFSIEYFIFEAGGTFLKKSEILEHLKDETSREFLKRQSPLPKEVLKNLVKVRLNDNRPGVKTRVVRIGEKT